MGGWIISGGLDSRPDEPTTLKWARRNAEFCLAALKVRWGEADTVYGYNAASLEIFEFAKQRGLRCVLDQTAAPWRWNSRMLREESDLWPEWESRCSEIDVNGALAAREESEWKLADTIICGSQFAADRVNEQSGGTHAQVVGYPEPPRRQLRTDRSGSGLMAPLRVLFVGTLQLRKGIQYLWQAKQLLGGAIEVRAVGPSHLDKERLALLRDCFDVLGPRPRAEISEHLAWADVFVLPTLSEGSANVCFEAMAARVPVITTANAGSDVRSGENGWLVPIRDAHALADRLSASADIRALGENLKQNRLLNIPRGITEYGLDLLGAIRSGCKVEESNRNTA